jgi:hypothetical protein
MNLNMPDEQRMTRLKQLSPVESIQCWLDGDFGLDEESSLCFAIRKDPRITLSDDEIFDGVTEAIDTECNAHQCLERLAGSE